jgi:hypothetical protein
VVAQRLECFSFSHSLILSLPNTCWDWNCWYRTEEWTAQSLAKESSPSFPWIPPWPGT